MKIYEVDLSEPIKQWLVSKGCEVKCEVNSLDVMGLTQDQIIVAVELKKTLNLEVMNQAVIRQKIADLVYIGVVHDAKAIKSKRYQRTIYTLKRLGVGLLTVNLKSIPPQVHCIIVPEALDTLRSKSASKGKRTQLLNEFNKRSKDLNKGGSTRVSLMTAYKEESLKIAYLLDKMGPLSPKALVKLGSIPKKTQSIVYHNFHGWFERVDKGVYALTEKGNTALTEHASVVDFFGKEAEEC